MAMLWCYRCGRRAPATDSLAILAWAPAIESAGGVLCPRCLTVVRAEQTRRAS
jgi:hypothetical protein